LLFHHAIALASLPASEKSLLQPVTFTLIEKTCRPSGIGAESRFKETGTPAAVSEAATEQKNKIGKKQRTLQNI
jgi:hypothetical protein